MADAAQSSSIFTIAPRRFIDVGDLAEKIHKGIHLLMVHIEGRIGPKSTTRPPRLNEGSC
jgi:hypothetical protein